jgi:hypothetical protein
MSAAPSTNGSSVRRNGTHDQAPSTNRVFGEHDPSPPPSPNGGTDRDARGRFVAGNRGGPGNPFARQVAALRRACLDALTPERMRALVERVYAKALEGDMAAAKLLFSYTLGKPAEAVDPDTLDHREWQQFQKEAADDEQIGQVLGSMPVGLACEMARAALPGLAVGMAERFADRLQTAALADTTPAGGPTEGRANGVGQTAASERRNGKRKKGWRQKRWGVQVPQGACGSRPQPKGHSPSAPAVDTRHAAPTCSPPHRPADGSGGCAGSPGPRPAGRGVDHKEERDE